MRVLFVCLGNICRSPLAQGTFRAAIEARQLGDRFTIDSAGTGDWHTGEPPDPRAIAIAAHKGIDISDQRARPVDRDDFHRFDLIIGMDHQNVQNLTRMAAFDSTATIDLFLAQATGETRDIADPYYGDDSAFETAFDDIAAGADALASILAGKVSRDSG